MRLGPVDKATGSPTVLEKGKPRETRIFDGKVYGMETALPGDVAIIRAWKVDEAGNCQFRYTTKAFGQIMAKAAKITIVEAENIVTNGEIHPDNVHLQGIYVNRIVPATVEKKIEIRNIRQDDTSSSEKKSDATIRRERIARRTAKELKDGYYVNLGVGIPTLAPTFLDPKTQVWIQSENGILGMGPYPTEDTIDADIINAGKETVTLNPGASTFDSAESFAMIRGGHVGTFQLSKVHNLCFLSSIVLVQKLTYPCDRCLGPRCTSGLCKWRLGQLHDPRKSVQGNGRGHGSGRQSRQDQNCGCHRPRRQRRQCKDCGSMCAALDRSSRCQHDYHRSMRVRGRSGEGWPNTNRAGSWC